ncbi:hypothetical protein LOAG_11599 [Loa loa]|uniref:Uncharacterized protein n=1 Tax=Loa loa TaxID=7209 RepID=A0A1S0TMN0_LOALO|nr:hypothetical protein LOAG_11599 [Loa loa]EFO16902.1 hypothetical protein LOAG_11599 [Loa loa]
MNVRSLRGQMVPTSPIATKKSHYIRKYKPCIQQSNILPFYSPDWCLWNLSCGDVLEPGFTREGEPDSGVNLQPVRSASSDLDPTNFFESVSALVVLNPFKSF